MYSLPTDSNILLVQRLLNNVIEAKHVYNRKQILSGNLHTL